MEVATLLAIFSLLLALAGFVAGRQSASHAAGKESGGLSTDIRYIRSSVERIEARLDRDVQRLDGKIEALTRKTGDVYTVAVRAQESASTAHVRLNELV